MIGEPFVEDPVADEFQRQSDEFKEFGMNGEARVTEMMAYKRRDKALHDRLKGIDGTTQRGAI